MNGNGRLAALEPYPEHPSEIKLRANGHAGNRKSPKKQSHKQPNVAASQRFKALNTFIDFTMQDLKRADIVVWLTLFRDSREGVSRTSQADIARRGGLSVRAVSTAVAKLIDLKLLKVTHLGGLNKGPSSYQVQPLQEGVTSEARFHSTNEA